MTVSEATPIDRDTGDGTTTAFSFSYEVFDLADVVVALYDNSDPNVDKTGTKGGSGTYDYTVTGSLSGTTNRYTSVTVTFNTAPPTGWLLGLTRAQDREQDTSLSNGSAFSEKSVEFQLDKLVHMAQDLGEGQARANLANPATLEHVSDMTFDRSARVTGLPAPASGLDAVNKTYVDGLGLTVTTGDYESVDTLTLLQALAASNGDVVLMAGRSTAGDGAAGVFRFDSSDLSTEVGNDEVTTNDGDGGIYVAPASDKTGASGAWVRLTDRLASVQWYGAKADGTDDAAAIQAAIDANGSVRFPAGNYLVESTINAADQSRWVGEMPQSQVNLNSRVRIYSTRAALGDDVPIVRCSSDGTSRQSISFQNLQFVGDLSVSFADLAATVDQGIVGVDSSHVKQGLEFINCAFKNLHDGVRQLTALPFQGFTAFHQCHWQACYRAVDANPTTGSQFSQCMMYDCVDFVDSTSIVLMVGCSLNNSSFATENTQVSGTDILFLGGWIEGGNSVINPSKYGLIQGAYISETLSASGSTKFVMKPQGNDCTLEFIGSRVPTNTRLVNLGAPADTTSIFMRVIGAYNGTNFSNSVSISDSLDGSSFAVTGRLEYEGFGNRNSDAWNAVQRVSQVLREGNREVYRATIADDAATRFAPQGANGTLQIAAANASGAAAWSVSTEGVQSLGALGSLVFTTLTSIGSVLGGTTGVDGNLTVSINGTNNRIEIENRTGASIDVSLETFST